MARGSMKIGTLAWKERQMNVLAAKLSKLENRDEELDNFLRTVKPEVRDMARNYFTELMAVKK